jgi:starch phosphorylase
VNEDQPVGQPSVAYFSMEIAVDAAVPTYAGGLGVLAGDTVRSCADLGVPMVAVTLLHRRGYFRQRLDAAGSQREEPVDWPVESFLEHVERRVCVDVEGRPVWIGAWRLPVRGVQGAEVPTYFLDTDLPDNAGEDRRLTDRLYGGGDRYRLCQELVLGVGGVKLLRALGYRHLDRIHLNEGHAALAVLALLEERLDEQGGVGRTTALVDEIRRHCVFTTHTPVAAGHDRFPGELARSVIGARRSAWLAELGQKDELNLTDLALRASSFVNGVAMRHGEVSRGMFPEYPIRSITNGIHPATWAAPSIRALFDRHIPDWRHDALALRYAVGIPPEQISWAHTSAKRALIERVRRESGVRLRPEVLTLGFARRATAYKRATLILSDLERLAAIAKDGGGLQLVFAGKAHPQDAEGKALIQQVFAARDALRGRVELVYLADHDMDLARLLCAGSDVWLNTPRPPLEASGTSGMKAALNGVPSLSTLDGWWVEGCVEGVTGWAIGRDGFGDPHGNRESDADHAESLYAKLRQVVLPTFYRDRPRFLEMMRSAIALNASFFNTQRMVLQYLYDAYRPGTPDAVRRSHEETSWPSTD